MDLRQLQQPLKRSYRDDPSKARITLRARARAGDTPVACSVDVGRAIHEAQAHSGVGGPGTAACSGDLLLGALAACAEVTCQMVANAMGVEVQEVAVRVEGDLDLRGTLGLSKEAPVGLDEIRVVFDIEAPGASPEELRTLGEKTEQYCVVFQTLTRPPAVTVRWDAKADA